MTSIPLGDRGDILIVDDQPNNLRLLNEILATAGYKVRKALDGVRALDAAQLAPPDLILLDIMMPGLDGYEICRQLKADSRTQSVPVMFLSALDDIGEKIKAFSVGGVDFIPKPFHREEVLARVRTHMKIQNLHKLLQTRNALLSAEIEQRRIAETALQTALDDLKMAQEQIIAREKLAALGTLTAGVAHELGNPLNFVNNYAEGSIELTDELAAELAPYQTQFPPVTATNICTLLADLRENAVAIHHHGQRAERTIRSMMQHVHSEEHQAQSVDLHDLLNEAVTLAYHSRRVQNDSFTLEIEREYDFTLDPLHCLPAELSRALINLIDNALYAMRTKQQTAPADYTPTLGIRTEQQGDLVCISIRDNGTGISSIHQPNLFDPFFTTKPTGEGTGLGLSITHEIIVRQHRGSLEFSTESEDYTEFMILLPKTLV
jgi:two-component system, NtrC family, sensor kinase